jgi:hypothetical protein
MKVSVVMSIDLQGAGHATPLIPGAYDRNTPPYRQPGSTRADTSVAVPIGSGPMAGATIAERERDGRARIALTVIFAALGAWLVLQLLAPSLLP